MDRHVPVLLNEVLSWLPPKGLVLDGTVGDGGHAAAILAANARRHLIGLDRDPRSLARSKKNLEPYGKRWRLKLSSYADLLGAITDKELADLRFVLLDLGFSSAQMDTTDRGFSFQGDGPLDMRYDQTDMSLQTASEIVNRTNVDELANIIFKYGEEGRSRMIARAISEARRRQPITTTKQLADIIADVVHRHPKDKLHPATLTFQALRIAVNHELEELDYFLQSVVPALPIGCRVAVISFHSLEDRRVKQVFRQLAKPGRDQFGEPIQPTLSLLNNKPQVATKEEIATNPRSRSAKLRVVERI